MILLSVPQIFKIAITRASCSETTSKATCEIFAFYNFIENSVTLIDLFQNVVRLEILKNPLLTNVPILYRVYRNTSKTKLLTTLLKRLFKKFPEELCNTVPF